MISLLLASFVPTLGNAQSYPTKPVRMIQSLGVGGGSDPLARLMSQKLGESLGQPVIVETQAGAGGALGASMVARAAPDGYTFGFAAASGLVLRKFLSKAVLFDALKDFTPIMVLGETLGCVVASPSIGVATLPEAIEYSKRNSGKVNYGSSGIGTVHHLSGVVVEQIGGGQLTHVPYKSGGDSLNGLLSGQVQIVFGIVGTMVPHAKAGKAKMLAINSGKRFARMPEVPTIAEVLPGYERPPGWNGFVGPAGLPAAITKRLYEDLNRIANSNEVSERLLDLGFVVDTQSPEQFTAQLRRSFEISERIVRAAKLEPE
ncbi:MAG: Bug family tripartite tricarboxylate transporter substrate binding protein [Burkholderiales bacterium]